MSEPTKEQLERFAKYCSDDTTVEYDICGTDSYTSELTIHGDGTFHIRPGEKFDRQIAAADTYEGVRCQLCDSDTFTEEDLFEHWLKEHSEEPKECPESV